ncbi:ABC transporter permease [Cumulibacter soli]|uniref:ABC transporter permease n=1 Tax=Cumulibacter soli TaxID=2546344 RepID=UPI001068A11C|nr:ABC transporter permease [Cumulibacter soli]
MRFLLKRFLMLIPVLLVVTFASFYLTSLLPGDPAVAVLGPGATEEAIQQERDRQGLDDNILVRYGSYLGNVVQGDLGTSSTTKEDVSTMLGQRLPVTLELLVLSQVIAFALSIPLAAFAARRPGSLLDRFSTGGAFAMLAIPPFMLGVLFVYLFAVQWQIFPATGYVPFTTDPMQNLKTIALPALTLGLGSVAVYLRVLRSDMISTLQQDFITMARAKGMSQRWILLRHALRPSTFSLITVAGLNIGALIGGALIVESVFALPGIGTLIVTAIGQRDFLTVQGVVLVAAAGYVLVNFLVDVLYGIVDPRVRVEREA